MIVKLREKNLDYPDLTPDQPYFVIGIEANDYRILNDFGKPYLYPPQLFKVVEPREPSVWVTEYGEDGERYSYPPELNEVGFFEDYFDRKRGALSRFWNAMNARLSNPNPDVSDELTNSGSAEILLQEGRAKKLLDIAAEIVKAQASVEPMSAVQIKLSLIETFSTLQKMQKAEEEGLFLDHRSIKETSAGKAQVVKDAPRKSIQYDKIVCLECGIEMTQLTAKHLSLHNLTSGEYKQKWGFPLKQPLSAKSLTRARSRAAKKRGLPENLVKFLEQRRQKKIEAATANNHTAEKKVGKPRSKEDQKRAKLRRKAGGV